MKGEDVPSCTPLESVEVDKNFLFPMTSWENATQALTWLRLHPKERIRQIYKVQDGH